LTELTVGILSENTSGRLKLNNRAMHYTTSSENPMKYTDTNCEQYTEFLNAAEGVTYSYCWASKG